MATVASMASRESPQLPDAATYGHTGMRGAPAVSTRQPSLIFDFSVAGAVPHVLRTARGRVQRDVDFTKKRAALEAGRPRCSYSHINSLYDKPAHVRSAQSHTVSVQAARGRRARSLASLAKGRQARQIADRATAARAANKRRAYGRSGAQNKRAATQTARWPTWTSSSRAAASSNWK